MKSLKIALLSLAGTMLVMQQASAAVPAVPELDGSGAILSIGLVVGLVALIREKFYHK